MGASWNLSWSFCLESDFLPGRASNWSKTWADQATDAARPSLFRTCILCQPPTTSSSTTSPFLGDWVGRKPSVSCVHRSQEAYVASSSFNSGRSHPLWLGGFGHFWIRTPWQEAQDDPLAWPCLRICGYPTSSRIWRPLGTHCQGCDQQLHPMAHDQPFTYMVDHGCWCPVHLRWVHHLLSVERDWTSYRSGWSPLDSWGWREHHWDFWRLQWQGSWKKNHLWQCPMPLP